MATNGGCHYKDAAWIVIGEACASQKATVRQTEVGFPKTVFTEDINSILAATCIYSTFVVQIMVQESRHVATGDLNSNITSVDIKSPVGALKIHDTDDQWDNTFHSICSKLPDKDRFLLLQNQRPFTSTQLYEEIRPRITKYTQHGFQRFIGAIDPIISHINSFTGIINSFVQSHPEISGLVWGSLYLLITVGTIPAKKKHRLTSSSACRTGTENLGFDY